MRNINKHRTIKLPLYNDGMNEMNLKFAKESLLMDSFRECLEYVKVEKNYPKNNEMEVDLSIDVVIMTVDEYNELIRQK